MKKNQLYLKVHPYLWEFYRSYYGSEVIDVLPDSLLSVRIKTILQTNPGDYQKQKWKEFRIIVLNLPQYNFRIGSKLIWLEHRKFIDDQRQKLLSLELYKDFKNTFICFVLGYVMSGGTQMNGINAFCLFYNIEMTVIKTDSLTKMWNRSKAKKDWMIMTGKFKPEKRKYTFRVKRISENAMQ